MPAASRMAVMMGREYIIACRNYKKNPGETEAGRKQWRKLVGEVWILKHSLIAGLAD